MVFSWFKQRKISSNGHFCANLWQLTLLSCFLLVLFDSLVNSLIAAEQKTDAGNRLVYLDQDDPYYVSKNFPKLTTPQWYGDKQVKAVCVLAIDDMRDIKKYETYLRPILERLKEIDGRAGVSIMTCRVDPEDPHLQKWINEGVSIEVHTYDHPCPLLKDRDFKKAKGTVERCVDLLSQIPNSQPVAYRMPCCDSLNTVSPRFFTEIFNRRSPEGNYLQIDTSVFHVFTANDPELPKKFVIDPDGQGKIEKYVPTDRGFVNTIFDYPYPYPISRLCWEFSCVTPSDWSAQHRQKPMNPLTVQDWTAVMDATVLKQGTFNLVFHPHGWISNEQVIKLIDHAVEKHGSAVKFLSFQDVLKRMNQHLLAGQPLRNEKGADNGVRLLDLNDDGFMDVVIGNDKVQKTRIWNPKQQTWNETSFPTQLVSKTDSKGNQATRSRFGVLNDQVVLMTLTPDEMSAWRFDNQAWGEDKRLLAGLSTEQGSLLILNQAGVDQGVRFRDFNHDGQCELIVSSPSQQAIYNWSQADSRWRRLPWSLPQGESIVDAQGRDAGMRFVDVDEDGYDDVLFSNEKRYSLHLFSALDKGLKKVFQKQREADDDMPMISRNGTNNGAWFHSRHLWVQNEDTDKLKNLVDGKSFDELLEAAGPQPKSPDAALKTIKVKPGFRVELVAAEPLLKDPVAFDWGPDGKLWVAEMADYPLGIDEKGTFGGRVRYLEDLNGDGTYEKSTLFLEGLGFPTGVMAWKKGVIVTTAPEVFYAEDTNGDGKADQREPLFTGFREGNQQHRVNGLRWGLDNWVYLANGDSGGELVSVKTKQKLKLGRRDLRIKPGTGQMDPQSGQTQFGRERDNWGNWFGSNNSNPAFHYALTDHYLRRNKNLIAPSAKVQVSVKPGAATIFPISRTQKRFNDLNKVNRITSACGLCFYRDQLLGPEFVGNSFICEPVHNLVHREVVSPRGTTFTSRRAQDEQESEFMASTDNWFRPTMARTGPDGALWVADMYRHVIEHPEWIPKAMQEKLDLRAGKEQGRIYRVVREDTPLRPIPRLDQLSDTELVQVLESPNGTQRDMAHQLLVTRNKKTVVPDLKAMVQNGRLATARLHALCVLNGLGEVSTGEVLVALKDQHPGVRRHAIRISESIVKEAPEVGTQLLSLVHDRDSQVRMQLAYTLGEWNDPQSGAALARMSLRQDTDAYFRTAVLSSVGTQLGAFVDAFFVELNGAQPPDQIFHSLVNMAVSANQQAALAQIYEAVGEKPRGKSFELWKHQAVATLLNALGRRNRTLSNYHKQSNKRLQSALENLKPLFVEARRIADSEKTAAKKRILAMQLLGRGFDEQEQDFEILAEMLSPRNARQIQSAAVRALTQFGNQKTPDILLERWKSFGPGLRSEVLSALLSREAWVESVLSRIEHKKIHPSEVDTSSSQLLLNHNNTTIRKRAMKLMASSLNSDRSKVIQQYSSISNLKGNTEAGHKLFIKRCTVCHQLNKEGKPIGPDLSALTDKSQQALLVAILDPNRAIESKYVSYLAVTMNGLTYNGLLAAESGESITLIQNDSKPVTLLRNDLEELLSTGKSLMPEGLEKDISLQEMSDVIAYLNATKQPRKIFAGNQPEVVQAEALRGEFFLVPQNAEIFGETIQFEKKYQNLGYWQSENDRALWTLNVPKSGKFDVYLEYACPQGVAGNRAFLEVNGQRITWKVPSTGSWDIYQSQKIGSIELNQGKTQLAVRSDGKIRNALFDLKTVRLRVSGN
ncbi:PVC-type heme-binding CxxCH protein [Gimesia aquarii]|uniref:Cytochrome c n=1 Tax=Gimesia aquarii TaxID=2527964 RepID=A0A517WXC9_9PLAN|nr:PVC-type heme-binding CxxCH protein [Gimesia aquarii]QDU09909.1 Cytochrome c [Gimesia aquarii]